MKKLVILTLLITCSVSVTEVSFATGSCSPNYMGYTSVQCSATGPANYTETYYKSTYSNIYVHIWGYAPASSDNVYVFAYYPDYFGLRFLDLSLYSTPAQQDAYDAVYGASGSVVLYVESYGSNAIYGGSAASW